MSKQPEGLSKPARVPTDTRDADRQAELKRQAEVHDAVHDATHDAKGNPAPLGMVLIEGKP